MVVTEPFPYWDIDPGQTVLPTTGITPMQSMSLDVVTLLACGAALMGEIVSGAAVLLVPFALWALGTIAALVHGLWLRHGTVEDIRIGSAWIAAMSGGLTAMHICRDPRLKRVTLAAAVGIVAMLAAKGAIQVFYEHAMTVARYRADRAGFLESQGMAADSVSAKNFERRLNQAEATGWFGLANVFATLVAAGLIALLGCAILAWREARVTRRMPDGWAGVLTLGALASGGALILAGSKGGFTAAGFGIAVLAIFMLLQRRKRTWILTPRGYGVLAVGLIFGALAAVVVRGLVGERVGELSLLFRWYYMEGAARAFAEHPIWGTGPDGFKDAYMRLKPGLSPEEVSSPHSVLFDFAGTLGVFGLAWGALWLAWVGRVGSLIGREINSGEGERLTKGAARPELWTMGLAISAAVLASTWVERVMGSPEQAAIRLVGFAGWIALGVALLSLLRVSASAAAVIAIGTLGAALHCQIEVTPTWTGSVGWMCLMLGATGASDSGGPVLERRARFCGLVASIGPCIAAALLAWLGVAPTARWESALRDAADQMRLLADIRTRLSELASGKPLMREGDSGPQLSRDLGALTDALPPETPAELQRAMTLLDVKCSRSAVAALEAAARLAPLHQGTTESLCRVLMEVAVGEASLSHGAKAEEMASRAVQIAKEFGERKPTSGAQSLIGNIEASRFDLTHDPAQLSAAIAAWAKGAALDPYGTAFPLRIFKALVSQGRTGDAKPWAARLIELDSLQRLDPLKKLTDDEMAAVKKVLNTP